jgi:hypothetical protein
MRVGIIRPRGHKREHSPVSTRRRATHCQWPENARPARVFDLHCGTRPSPLCSKVSLNFAGKPLSAKRSGSKCRASRALGQFEDASRYWRVEAARIPVLKLHLPKWLVKQQAEPNTNIVAIDQSIMNIDKHSQSVFCKICGSPASAHFALPRSKKTGFPIPDEPSDCVYYQCGSCKFLFATLFDEADHTEIYDDTYWSDQDPDWYGRVSETLRLVLLANELLHAPSDSMDILDFGCGTGAFVEISRKSLQMNVWGTDIIQPKLGSEYFLHETKGRCFDIIVACEVVEHLPFPQKTFHEIRSLLKSPGAFAFQTAQWDPDAVGSDWWYLGPANGHISLYSREALDVMFRDLGGKERRLWRNYPGVQAWLFD